MEYLYGIEYNTYIGGGYTGTKACKKGSETSYYRTESDMLRGIATLKDNNLVGEIEPFVAKITRVAYDL